MSTLHNRSDWHKTHGKMLDQLIETFKAIGRVPKIKDLCERHGLCSRTVKLHKRHFELAPLVAAGKITQEEYAVLAPHWEGVRPYKKSELSEPIKKDEINE
jgi:hypothetical protein